MPTTVAIIPNDTYTTNQTGSTTVPTSAHYAQIVMNISDIAQSALTPIVSIVVDSTPYQYHRYPLLNQAGTFPQELLPVFEGDTFQVEVLRDDNENYVYGVDVTFLP